MTVATAMRMVVAAIAVAALGVRVRDGAQDASMPSPPSVEYPPAVDYAILFRDSDNYRQFITRAPAAAKAGDAQAQYYIAAALGYCDEAYRFYFKRRDKVLSLDEAIAVQTNRGSFQYIEALKRADLRCRGIHGRPDQSWGTADEWLARAALDLAD